MAEVALMTQEGSTHLAGRTVAETVCAEQSFRGCKVRGLFMARSVADSFDDTRLQCRI